MFIKCTKCGVTTEVKLNHNGIHQGRCAACESVLTIKGDKNGKRTTEDN